jgi:(2Fe-2S) ferredoxin
MDRGAVALRDHFKARCKSLGIEGVRINQAGCLDRCELGPTIVIYPEGVWYRAETIDQVDQIINQHLIGGQVVEALQLDPTM